jgi:hypothetical protein
VALSPYVADCLALEARALLTRLARVRPFALIMPMVAAAAAAPEAVRSIEHYLMHGRLELRGRVHSYLRWLVSGRAADAAEAQRRFSFLKLRFDAVLAQFHVFSDALAQRGEVDNGVWLAGLDVAAADALALPGGYFEPPPVITYIDSSLGAAIRRARTRLPGGGSSPVAVLRLPRERMVGSGIASSLVHETGHQGAALLGLVESLRRSLQERGRRAADGERDSWRLWERWISEIAADFWSLAKLGVAATLGLMQVVSLPRAFVFRIQPDDPHPFPWIRVELSIALGALLFPDPQWRRIDHLWRSLYPPEGLDGRRAATLAGLDATLPQLVRLLALNRPPALQGAALHQVFPVAARQPARLRALYDVWRREPDRVQRAAPTLVFAVLGQARQDRRLSPERESTVVAELLRHWALRRALGDLHAAAQAPRALAA